MLIERGSTFANTFAFYTRPLDGVAFFGVAGSQPIGVLVFI